MTNITDTDFNPARGEIYYIAQGQSLAIGSEQRPDRPGIIVSNDNNNKFSRTVEVIYLTTQPKHDLPVHVEVEATGRTSTALCEQIHTVDMSRLGNYCGACSAEEMHDIDEALMLSLGVRREKLCVEMENIEEFNAKANAVKAERDRWMQRSAEQDIKIRLMREMYNELLDKFHTVKSDKLNNDER